MLGDRTRRSVRPHEPVRRHGTGSATRRMDRRRPQQPCKVPCRLVRTSYVLNCRRHPRVVLHNICQQRIFHPRQRVRQSRHTGRSGAVRRTALEISGHTGKIPAHQQSRTLRTGNRIRRQRTSHNRLHRLLLRVLSYRDRKLHLLSQLGDQSQLHIHRQRQIQPVGRNGNRTSHRLLERQRRKQSSGVRSRKRHALPRLQSDRINHLQTRIQTLALVHRSCHSHRSRQHLDGILAAPRQRPAWRKHVQRREPRPDSHERKNALERTQHRQRRIIRRLSQLRITFRRHAR